jgi:RNA polymerase sigma-70 factor (ECF subfamily)
MGDERQLVRRVLAGDPDAFRDLVRRYERLVAHLVARMIHDSRDREELCQDVFLRVYDRLPGFRFESRLSTWIAKISYRLCLNAVERKQPATITLDALPDHDAAGDSVDLVTVPGDEVFDRAEHEQLVTIVHRAIDELPLRYRTAVTLYHLEELGVGEIANIMEVPEGTVKSYLFRARRLLRRDLVAHHAVEDLQR